MLYLLKSKKKKSMWYLLEILVLLLLVIAFFTEFLIPILTNKPIFGSFRSVKKTEDSNNINEKLKVAKQKVDAVKKVQNEVSAHFKTAEQLMEESENLLK